MASRDITVNIQLEGDLTHCGQLMTKTSSLTTWEQGFEVTTVEFTCTAGCGATTTVTSRDPA
jgi:hypothetical protein